MASIRALQDCMRTGVGKWLQPCALSRGERMSALHEGKSSPSTSAVLYGEREGGWEHP